MTAEKTAEKIPVAFLRKRAWEGLLTAGMNVRYHQALSSLTGTADSVLRIVTAVAASSTFASSPVWNTDWGKPFIIALSLIAAVASVCLALLPLKKWEEENNKFVEEWTPIRDAWERIFDETNFASDDTLDRTEAEELRDKQTVIEGLQHKAVWGYLLSRCEKAERRARGLPEAVQNR